MKTFKFSYQSILKVRKTQEDLAQKKYIEVQHELNIAKQELNHLYEQLQSTYYSQKDIKQRKENFSLDCELMDYLAVGLRKKIDLKINDVREVYQRVEEAYEIFLQAHKSRKVLEKLKEKEKVEYNKLYKKYETKLTDEVVSYKYAKEIMDEKKRNLKKSK